MLSFSPMPHAEAVSRIAGLPVVSRGVMDEMLPELRAYAFTVSGLDGFDQMAKVRDMIQAVPAGEQTWAKAKTQIAAELSEDLGGKAAERRAELLLRTHVFRGYAASRYRRLIEQVDVFPFWQYKTHGDGNVRPSHAALNGKIFPAGDPIWQRIFPPWDWGCRCLVVPLTKRSAEGLVQAGKPSDEAASAGHLLKSQIVKPEIFTAKEAAIIDKNQRLPGGVPLNRTPTFAAAPWSQPGNIQHDWQLIKARYADQPDVLKAFTDWAGKQEITQGVTVSMWIGEGPVALPKLAVHDEVPGALKTAAMREADNAFIRKHQVPREHPPSAHARPADPRLRDAPALAMEKASLLQDSAHDDGGLADVLMTPRVVDAASAGEYYAAGQRGALALANMNPGGGTPILTTLHELGHHVEDLMLSESATAQHMHAVVAAARRTHALGALAGEVDAHLLAYYTCDSEVWARAYAQYVAEASGDAEVAAELALIGQSRTPSRAWQRKDFEPVKDAITLLLKTKGWL
jgi:SPP1 gp7 family putative phage head morphogenesis protein